MLKNIINSIKKNGNIVNSLLLCIYFAPIEKLEKFNGYHPIFSIGRKVGNAVCRNHIKRIIRASLYIHRYKYKFFVIVKKQEKYNRENLKESLEKLHNFINKISSKISYDISL